MSDIPLSLPRRFIGDLLHAAQQVPLATVRRRLDLAQVVKARLLASPRPGWCALFTRAYALVAERRPVLRCVFVPLPWPHLYEHPSNVAAVSIQRYLGEEPGVFVAHLREPEQQSLAELEQHLKRFRNEPLASIGLFRRILNLARLPRIARRLCWWLGTQVSGSRKARHLGTFGVSVVSGQGAVSPHLRTPVTTALNYGPIDPEGQVDIYLTFDQRVVDPQPAAQILVELEQTLNGKILEELEDAQA